ncbi:MAG: hypothetical protein K0Q95_2096 [Bacteroidota bacterium]|jgi:hypothetical protein|nr:hypothetical protein [Bacteroidota bacterium]
MYNQKPLSRKEIIDLLASQGFRKDYNGTGGCIFKKINENLIEVTNPIKIKDFLIKYFKANKDKLEQFYAKADHLVDSKALELLPSLEVTYLKDTKVQGFFLFKNCLIKVSKEGFEATSLNNIEPNIKFKREISHDLFEPQKESEFERFLFLAMGKDDRRLQSLKSSIGYLLHDFYDPSERKAVIYIDEEINESGEANGGTGKSIVAMAISRMLGDAPYVINEDGRNFNPQKGFAFQQLTSETKLLIFNDTSSTFAFNRLISALTDGITVEKKYKDAFRLSGSSLPKVLITTNFLPEGDLGYTNERRRFEVEFAPYFGKERSPRGEFGHLLFEEWHNEEWNAFYCFMLDCLRLYLAKGLIHAPNINLFKKQIIRLGGMDVLIFLDGYFQALFPTGEIRACKITKGELYSKFKTTHPNSNVTNTKLPKLVKIYLDGLKIKNKEYNVGGVRGFEIMV